MLLNPPNQLPLKETTLEHVATVSGAFTIPLTLASIQLALGVRLLINGLQQSQDSFTAAVDGITIPVELEVITDDVIHVLYYEAL